MFAYVCIKERKCVYVSCKKCVTYNVKWHQLILLITLMFLCLVRIRINDLIKNIHPKANDIECKHKKIYEIEKQIEKEIECYVVPIQPSLWLASHLFLFCYFFWWWKSNMKILTFGSKWLLWWWLQPRIQNHRMHRVL